MNVQQPPSPKIWAIGPSRESTPIRILQEHLLARISKDGINPGTVRVELEAQYGGEPILFRITDGTDDLSISSPQMICDFNLWSWIPILSLRAKNLIVDAGGEANDFVRCLFESNPAEDFFLHLPVNCHDIVDTSRSKFMMEIPLTPPLPHGIQSLVLQKEDARLPPCFRARVPDHHQVFSELLFTDQMQSIWRAARLTGAEFRLLTS